MSTIADRRRTFRDLHRRGCFVIPNPWDAGSARVLAQLGFLALATTSSGFAWSIGRADNHVTLDQALAYIDAVARAVDVPVSADFEGGFAIAPADVGANVARAAATAIAGLSIGCVPRGVLSTTPARHSCSPPGPKASSPVAPTWERRSAV